MNTKIGNRNTGITHRRLTDNRCPVRRPLPDSGIVAASGTSADSRAARPPDAGRTRQPHRSAGRILSLLLALPLFFGLASQAMAQIEVPGISPSTPVEFTSMGPYTIDGTITVTVTFVDTVTVGGTPRITLMVGTETRSADYTSGTGNTMLVFTYTVAADENDENGVSIPANALALNGGTIQDDMGTDAILTHAAVLDDAAQVVDTRMPEFVSASVTADNLVLTYDETLDNTSTPANDDYTIMVTDTATPSPTVPTVNDPVVINGANVMLTLSRNITTTETFRLTYTPGTNPLRDVAGNNADSLMNEEVVRPSQEPMFDDMVDDPQTYTVGTPVDLTLPTATVNSESVGYALVGPGATLGNDDLPAGLTFDLDPRTLSGTPTTAMNEVMLTYTATDGSGRSTFLTFTVIVAAAPASVTISEMALTVDEEGVNNTATYTVVLDTQPTADVMITPVSDAPAATVSATLTFTTANWDAAQTVTVTGMGDDIDNPGAARTATVSHTADSTDTNYEASSTAGSNIASVTVTVTDDDTAGVRISTPTLGIAEGGRGTYTVRLDSQPTGDVIVTVGGASGDVSVTNSPLTFTTGNWDMEQTVTVNAAEDDDAVADAVTLTHGVTGYGTVSSGDEVVVTVTENDTAGVRISTPTLGIAEGGRGTYTVRLDSQPTGDVIVTVGGASGDVSVTNSPLTFTTGNWDMEQTVTVNAAEDDDAVADAVTLTHGVTGYGTVSSGDEVVVTVTENDTAGVRISTPTLTIAEGGRGTYTVRLDSQPAGNVEITVGGASGDVSVTNSPLTFTTGNWNLEQTVTVNAAEDDDAVADTVTLTHGVTGYGTVSSGAEVVVTVTENDLAGVRISTPTLGIDEGGRGTYTVRLDSQPTGDVIVTVGGASGDVSVTNSPLTFTTGNWDMEQTVTVNAAEDDDAVADTVTLTHGVTGYGTVSSGDEVVVTVTENRPGGRAHQHADVGD